MTLIADIVAAMPQSAVVVARPPRRQLTHDLDRLVGFRAQTLDVSLVEGP